MIAAPGVTRFVGAGGMEAARAVSEEMAEIYLERNMQLQIPGWDFQGACLGLSQAGIFRARAWDWTFVAW